MPDRQALESAIASLEAQRTLLGDAVTDAAIAPLRAQLDGPPAGRLQHVSILFVDVVGSTALSRQLDPEDIVEILDRALAGFEREVRAHQGRVLQFMGDGLLAVFGDGTSAEQGAENAVRAALAVIEHARQLAASLHSERRLAAFEVRAGIDSGPVLLGAGVDAEGSIRGNAVNMAARMEQAAPQSGLRISEQTYRLVRGLFEFGDEATIAVKGAREPVRTFLVRRALPRAFAQATRGIEGIETPMIGRDEPLRQLQSAWRETCLAPCVAGARISVLADAGVGKSRLAHAFERWLAVQPEPPALLEARAQRQTLQQPYGLLREWLTGWLRIGDDDDAATARRKLAEGLLPLAGDDGLEAVHLVGHLIGVDHPTSEHLRGILADPAQIRDRALAALVQLLRRLAQRSRGGCVMLLDDLHWADDASIDATLQLAAQPGRLLIVAFARPTLMQRRPDWIGTPTHTTLQLQPLAETDREALADALLQGVDAPPATLRELITRHGDGNPFFMEEIFRMLVDEGALASSGVGRWQVVPQRLRAAHVPATLAGVLQARLAVLRDEERKALQQAAVIGFVHWDQAIAAIEAGSAPMLDRLSEREFIVPHSVSGLEGAREFQFQHHLMHQFAYDTTLRRERRAYHAKAAAWLAARAGSGHSELQALIGEHHEQAGELPQAVACYTRAAEDAAARGARPAAAAHADRALLLAGPDDAAARWPALLVRESALANQEQRALHDADLQALRDIAEQLAEEPRRAEAWLRTAAAHVDHGEYSQAETAARQALRHAQSAGDTEREARALGHLSMALRRMDRFTEARVTAEAAVGLARAGSNAGLVASMLLLLSGASAESGDLANGAAYARESLALLQSGGDRHRQARGLTNLADTLMRLGCYEEAQARLLDALQLAQRLAFTDLESLARINLGAVALLRGQAPAALEQARSAVADAAAIDAHDLHAAALLVQGLAEAALGQVPAARASFERCAAIFRGNAGPHLALEAQAELALLSLGDGKTGEAIAELAPILEHLQSGGRFNGTEEPLRIMLHSWQVLRGAGDSRAHALLRLTHDELQARAARISDEALRQGFLSDVPHNRAIVQAWAEFTENG